MNEVFQVKSPYYLGDKNELYNRKLKTKTYENKSVLLLVSKF